MAVVFRAWDLTDRYRTSPGCACSWGFLFHRETPMITTLKCPRCRTETVWEGNPHRPFCSARCKTVDLAAWADEEYRIVGPETPADNDENDRE